MDANKVAPKISGRSLFPQHVEVCEIKESLKPLSRLLICVLDYSLHLGKDRLKYVINNQLLMLFHGHLELIPV